MQVADIDYNINFDSPSTSSTKAVHVTGQVPQNNPQGYVRITVNITNSIRNDFYYRTISIEPNKGGPFNGTYNVAISPRILSSDSATISYSFSFTAQTIKA